MSTLASARIHDHKLETPHITLQHPNGHKVQVIGVIHYALPSTWKAIGDRLALLARRGWTVHYEMVKKPSRMSPRELHIDTIFRKFWRTLSKKFEASGAIYQLGGLTYPRGAVNTDIALNELYASYRGSTAKLSLVISLYNFLISLVPTSAFIKVLGNVLVDSTSDGPDIVFDNRVVMDKRNQIAVSYCLAAAPQNVVMVWGAAHVDGIVALLLQRGYRTTRSQWIPMLNLHS